MQKIYLSLIRFSDCQKAFLGALLFFFSIWMCPLSKCLLIPKTLVGVEIIVFIVLVCLLLILIFQN